jgi:hypothetical protein
MEHEPFVVTASFFKNEESFIKLCKENGTRVIAFKEACHFTCGPKST